MSLYLSRSTGRAKGGFQPQLAGRAFDPRFAAVGLWHSLILTHFRSGKPTHLKPRYDCGLQKPRIAAGARISRSIGRRKPNCRMLAATSRDIPGAGAGWRPRLYARAPADALYSRFSAPKGRREPAPSHRGESIEETLENRALFKLQICVSIGFQARRDVER